MPTLSGCPLLSRLAAKVSVILSGRPEIEGAAEPEPPPPRALGVTFTRKGYGRLLRSDGSLVSQHIVAEEAYERAAKEGAGVYRWVPAQIEIQVP